MTGATLSHYAEYYALRGAVATLRRVELVRAGQIGAWLGALGFAPLGMRREVVERQLRAAFPGLSPAEVQEIARESYAQLGRTAIETALLPTWESADILRLVDQVEGWDVVERALGSERGVMFVTGHIGNWELAGAYLAARGVPLEVVARRMQNPLFDRYLTRTRRRLGMTVIPDAEAVRRVPRALAARHAVAFLVDQGAVGLASTWVPFFGRYAKTPRGPAVFALRLRAPLVFGCALRQTSGRYAMHFQEVPVEDTGDREADVDRIVRAYTTTLEQWVRRAPGQYFWHHRRWKHQRPGTPAELGDPS